MHYLFGLFRNPENAIPREFEFLDTEVVNRLMSVTALWAATGTLALVTFGTLLAMGSYLLTHTETNHFSLLGTLSFVFGTLILMFLKLDDALEYLYGFQQGYSSGRASGEKQEEERHQQKLKRRRLRYQENKLSS